MNIGQRTYRLGLKALLILKGHILNPLWQSRKQRHDNRQQTYAGIRKYFDKYYLEPVLSLPSPAASSESSCALTQTEPEKIFSIWLQGRDSMPPIVKSCIASIEKNCSLPLVLLDSRTLPEYIDLPGYIIDKHNAGKMGHAHFSDLCRVELLKNHGGVWMDATLFTTEDIPGWIIDEDFFVYMVGGVGDRYSFMQNCFIRSKKGNFLLEAWRTMMHEYWKKENSRIDYYLHQLMFESVVTNDPRAAALFARMPKVDQDPTHNLWWGHRLDTYTPERFKQITEGSFYQKTSYKFKDSPAPETMAYQIINGRI